MKPRFYKNIDNNHCLQCCIRIVLNTILAEQVTESVVDRETYYDSTLWTWTIAGAKVLSLRLKDIKIVNGGFDYKRFIDDGVAYLKGVWKNGRYAEQSKHASKGFRKEIRLASQFLNTGGIVEHTEFSEAKIDELLKDNFVIAQINHSRLYNLSGSSSHYILIYGQAGDNYEIHDPGQPWHESYLISKNKLLFSFSSELIAIPKPGWWSPQNESGRNDPCPCGSGKKNKKCHDL